MAAQEIESYPSLDSYVIEEEFNDVQLELKIQGEEQVDQYEGEMVLYTHEDGQQVWYRHGYGVLTTSNEISYGRWQYDILHGHGIKIVKDDGDIYCGQYFNGQRHGLGRWFKATGECYLGIWDQNQQHGLGSFMTQMGTEEGWFAFGKLQQPIFSEEPQASLKFGVDAEMQQPERGLTVLASFLEKRIECMLRTVINDWRLKILDYVIEKVQNTCDKSFEAWSKSCKNQEAADEADYMRQKEEFEKIDDIAAVVKLKKHLKADEVAEKKRLARLEQSAHDFRVAELNKHNQKLFLQHLHHQLKEITAKEEEADAAKEACHTLDLELLQMQSEIEKAQVELNNLKRNSPKFRKKFILFTPPSQRRVAARNLSDTLIPVQTYACGVVGCNCGVTKEEYLKLTNQPAENENI